MALITMAGRPRSTGLSVGVQPRALPPDRPEAAWDSAKAQLLRGLSARRYPAARLLEVAEGVKFFGLEDVYRPEGENPHWIREVTVQLSGGKTHTVGVMNEREVALDWRG